MARKKYINIEHFKEIKDFWREGFPLYTLIILLYLQMGTSPLVCCLKTYKLEYTKL
jgi:hypothetical protein